MKRFKTAAVCATAVAVAFVWGFSPAVQKANAQTTNTPWQHLTLSQLSAVWWQWAFSIPVSSSPLLDTTGAQAFNGQPYSDLLFLGGTFIVTQLQNGDTLGQVTRSITVKRGTALFFPLLNNEWDNVCNRPNLGGNCFGYQKYPASLSVPQLQALVTAATDNVTSVNSTIKEGLGPIQNLDTLRLVAPPFQFSLPPVDNLYQLSGGGRVAPAAADGYFSFVPGLATGTYKLHFGGSEPTTDVNGNPHTFTEDITYLITVTN